MARLLTILTAIATMILAGGASFRWG